MDMVLREATMSDYRRRRVRGGTYFFTVVTHRRRPFLTAALSRNCLRTAIAEVRAKWPFRSIAMVLLPDHWHAVLELPRGDDRYSLRLQKIKESFTRSMLQAGVEFEKPDARRRRRQERTFWQPRFWEHVVRDEVDLKRCVDYVHWNPRKHRLVSRVVDWPWSTFQRYVRRGEYDANWGGTDPCPNWDMPE